MLALGVIDQICVFALQLNNILIRFLLIITVFFGLILLWLFWNTRTKFIWNRERSSPFECGFDPKDKSRIPFSMRFFLIIILFLIFDLEIALLLQVPFVLELSLFKGRIGLLIFVWILLLGTYEEWRRGILDWKS